MKVKYVPSDRIKGYYGMNHEAGKELGVYCPKNTILVDSELKGRMLKRTIAHEKLESYLMKEKGMSYKDADRVAMSFEKRVK